MQDVQLLSELFPTTSSSQRGTNNPSELGQEDFLTLLVAQLENQNPTQPTDNMEFISQIAQFGTVSGVQDLNESFDGFSSTLFGAQGLQAAGLVGSGVISGSNLGALEADQTLAGTVQLPQSTGNINLLIQDGSGRLVRSIALGSAAAGDFRFEWDGTDGDGNLLPPGNYSFSAEAVIGSEAQALQVNVHNRVDSVTVDRNGASILLNLDTGEQINIAEVRGFL